MIPRGRAGCGKSGATTAQGTGSGPDGEVCEHTIYFIYDRIPSIQHCWCAVVCGVPTARLACRISPRLINKKASRVCCGVPWRGTGRRNASLQARAQFGLVWVIAFGESIQYKPLKPYTVQFQTRDFCHHSLCLDRVVHAPHGCATDHGHGVYTLLCRAN